MHTPGPWSIVRYGDGSSLVIHSDEDNRVCFMATASSDRPTSHAAIRANARLIAAAPELYEALDFAMNAMMGMREAFVELDIRIPPTLDAEIKRARETLSRAVPVSTGSPQAVSENGNVQGVK